MKWSSSWLSALRREHIIPAASVGLFLLLGTSLPDMFFEFYIAGFIPGTTWAIPWLILLLIYLEAGFFTIRYAHTRGLYPASPRIKKAQARMVARELRNQKRREAYAQMKAAQRRRTRTTASQVSRVAKRSQPTTAAPAKGTASTHHPQTA